MSVDGQRAAAGLHLLLIGAAFCDWAVRVVKRHGAQLRRRCHFAFAPLCDFQVRRYSIALGEKEDNNDACTNVWICNAMVRRTCARAPL